jgi:hypothetical protein
MSEPTVLLRATSKSGEVRLSQVGDQFRVERTGPRSWALDHRFLPDALRDFADRVDGRLVREVFGVE